MGHAITAYMVEHVVCDIRAKRSISAELCDEIYDATYHDRLRAELTHSDFDALIALCESREGAVQTLGISMLRQMVQHEDVFSYLQRLWRAQHLAFPAKVAVQHRLLDRADLPQEMHEELFRFVLENWHEWLALCAEYAGGPGKVLAWCETRINDDRFPYSKKWTYLCIAAAAEDREAARQLLRRHTGGLSFNASVAGKALARIGPAN